MGTIEERAFDRRGFITAIGGATLAMVITGCGRVSPGAPLASGTVPPVVDPGGLFEGGATVGSPPVRTGRSHQFEPLPRPGNWYPGQFVTHVDVPGRRMALTFDDGPSPYNTESVLRTLASFGVRATFFLPGVCVMAWPEIGRRTVDAGHEIGCHSVYHTPYTGSGLAAQIDQAHVILHDVLGVTPVVHRAPGLVRSLQILDGCARHGMYEAHTHMATYDWVSPRHSASQLISEFVRHHRNGAFAIYHDGGGPRPTPAALPSIIRHGLDIGYRFVPASELMLSGVPQPAAGRVGDAFERADGGDATADAVAGDGDGDAEAEVAGYVDRCNFDAEAELRRMLDGSLSLTYRDRMRVVGALAELLDAQRG